MNVSNKLQTAQTAQTDQIAEETVVVRALRATQANDAATGPPRHSEQTDQCPNIARFATVLRFGGSWTAEEAAHIATGCPFCQKVFAMFGAAAREAAQEDTEPDRITCEETTVELPRKAGAEDTKLG